MTIYDDLYQKMKMNRKSYETYEKDCRQFIEDLRSEFIKYLDCPEDRVIWEPFSSDEPKELRDEKGVIEVTLDQRMALYEDAFYGFSFRILFYNPKKIIAGGNNIILGIFIKKDNSKFTVKLGKDIEKFGNDELNKLSETLSLKIEEYLSTEFQFFLKGGEKPPLGFISSLE